MRVSLQALQVVLVGSHVASPWLKTAEMSSLKVLEPKSTWKCQQGYCDFVPCLFPLSVAVDSPWLGSVPVSFLSTWYKLEPTEKKEVSWGIAFIRLPVGKPMGHFLDWWPIWEGPAHCYGANPGQLSWVLKRTNLSKSVISGHWWSLIQFLPLVACVKFLPRLTRWNLDFLEDISMFT